jgi:Ca2+-binding RTX toxin-like protein
MRGSLVVGGIAAVAALLSIAGSAGARGGNHGCDETDRKVYSNHFFPNGDNIVVGHYVEEGSKFPPTPDSETVAMENSETGSLLFTSQSCGGTVFTWSLFESLLGPGDDSVRLDAVGMDGKYPVPPQPLPRRMGTLIRGESGEDLLRGHLGFDDMAGGGGDDRLKPGGGRDRVLGGAGNDVIKAAHEGKDNVQCGPGRDKAVVDKRDQIRGCERVRVVR